MKKAISALLIAAVFAISIVLMIKEVRKPRLDPATFLPPNTLVYYHQKDLDLLLAEMRHSLFGKALKRIDLAETARDLQLPVSDIAILEKIEHEGSDFVKGPVFKELFGDDYAVAWVPGPAGTHYNSIRQIRQELILISRPKHGARIVDLLSSGLGKTMHLSSENYGDYTIRHLQPEKGMHLSLVSVHGLVIVSLNDRLIKACLDRHTIKKYSLATDAKFKKINSAFKNPESFLYLAIAPVRNLLENFVPTMEPKQQMIIDENLKRWRGFPAAGYGMWKEKDRIKGKTVILLNRKRLEPLRRNLYEAAAEKDTSLSMVPAHVLGYYWVNTMDFPTYWRMSLQRSAISMEKQTKIKEAIKKEFGMEIGQILNMLDRRCGVMIQDQKNNALLPLPDFAFFVGITKPLQFKKFFENLINNKKINIKKQLYRGMEITSLSAADQNGLVRLYTIQHRYFIAATSMTMLKNIIDTMQGTPGLVESPEFKKVSTGLLEDNNSVGYLRIGDLTRTIKRLAYWGTSLMAIQNQQKATELGSVMDHLVNPLLDGLSVVTDYTIHRKISSDRIVIESTSFIEN